MQYLQRLFLSFDDNNKFSDGGGEFGPNVSMGQGGKDFKVKEKTNLSYMPGVHSGWKFDDG